jgi:transcriptional regulator with XRE-family HTH domain
MSSKILNIPIKIREGAGVKKFEYEGQKNICGDRVRVLRVKKRLSQAALAAKMQTEGVIMEQDVVSRIESGDRLVTDYELRAFAAILGTDPNGLLDMDP